jgi:hypothetical protein
MESTMTDWPSKFPPKTTVRLLKPLLRTPVYRVQRGEDPEYEGTVPAGAPGVVLEWRTLDENTPEVIVHFEWAEGAEDNQCSAIGYMANGAFDEFLTQAPSSARFPLPVLPSPAWGTAYLPALWYTK